MAGFTDTGTRDGMLHVFDYRRGKRYRVKPGQAARERDFYCIKVTGENPNVIEKDLSRLEGELAPTLRRVTETDVVRYQDKPTSCCSPLWYTYGGGGRWSTSMSGWKKK